MNNAPQQPKLSEEEQAALLVTSRIAQQDSDFDDFWKRVEDRLNIEEEAEKDLVKPRKTDTV